GAAHPTGLVNLTISTGGHLYVLTSTSVDQFTGSGGKATIQATGVLTDLTNLLHPHVLDTQASVQLSLKAGPGPTAAVALKRSDGTIAFVAGWNGTTLIPLPLSSGMINIS